MKRKKALPCRPTFKKRVFTGLTRGRRVRGHVAGGRSSWSSLATTARSTRAGTWCLVPAWWVQASTMALTSPGLLYLRCDSKNKKSSKFPNSKLLIAQNGGPLTLLGKPAKKTPQRGCDREGASQRAKVDL